jgi:hypothetical protein
VVCGVGRSGCTTVNGNNATQGVVHRLDKDTSGVWVYAKVRTLQYVSWSCYHHQRHPFGHHYRHHGPTTAMTMPGSPIIAYAVWGDVCRPAMRRPPCPRSSRAAAWASPTWPSATATRVRH